MKKYLLAVLLLASFQSFGQFLNYTNINGRYKWIAGKFDSTFTIPSGTTPSLRVGGGTGPGALFYSTTDSTVYQYTGTQWTRLRGSDTAHVISAYVRNTTASAMTPGQVVYINGSTGTTPTIALAVNKQDSTSAMTFGFVRGNIPVNGFGYITTFGPLEGVNTNAYDEGEVIYLDSIPGQFTHDKPQAPYHMVTLGYIIKKSGGNGTIYAKIQNGYELEELHNVRITEPVLNKSVIIYDSVRRLWVDTTVSAAGLGLGGSGTTNYVSKWTGSTALGNSQIFDNGTAVGIGTGTLVTKAGKWLQVTQDGTDEVAFVINRTAGSFPIRWDFYVPNNTRQLRLYNNSTGDIGAFTQAGRLLIGTTTESTFELDVVGDIRSTLDANINGLTVGKGGGSISSNTAFGVQAINSGSASGGSNTAIGYFSLKSVTTGYENTAIGTNSLTTLTNGHSNVAIGLQAGEAIAGGYQNVLIGKYAGWLINTGYQNTLIGNAGGADLTTGISNTVLGYNTGRGITTGSYNTIIGAGVSGLSSSLSNTIILADGQGNQRLYINNSGNVGIGSTNPASKLTLNQTATGEQKISFTLTGTEYGYFAVNTASGRVNLGSDSYSTRYFGTSHIFNNTVQLTTSTFTGQNPKFDIGGGFGSMYVNWDSPSFNIESSSNTAYSMRFNTGGSERMRIFGGGNIAIGTTTDAGYKLQVAGTSRFDGNMLMVGQLSPSSISQAGGRLDINLLANLSRGIRFTNSSQDPGPNNLMEILTGNTYGNITSGTANIVIINPTINQTSGAGTIIGYRFNPTNTAVVSSVYSFYADSGTAYFGSNVGVGTASPNTSALLDVSSTTKGFLPPRMTNAQMVAISTPAAGLVVYDTTNNKLNVYDGTNWVAVH